MSEPGRKWDGKSRIPTEEFKKNFDEIFGKKEDKDKKEEDELQLNLDV